jgi:RimJ/RimL family protein N-acetyltransferase
MRLMQAEDVDAVRDTLPSWEIAKYLGLPKGPESEKMAREVLLRTIAEPEPKKQLIWTVALRDAPHEIVGVVHLQKEDGVATENIWLNEGFHTGGYAEEVLEAVNEFAFTRAGVQDVRVKGAFTHAANPQEMEAMRRRYSATSFMPGQKTPRAKSAGGAWGFNKETFQRGRRQVNILSEQQMNSLGTPQGNLQGNPEMQSIAVKQRRERQKRAKSGFVADGAAPAAPKAPAQKPAEQKPPETPKGPKPQA